MTPTPESRRGRQRLVSTLAGGALWSWRDAAGSPVPLGLRATVTPSRYTLFFPKHVGSLQGEDGAPGRGKGKPKGPSRSPPYLLNDLLKTH